MRVLQYVALLTFLSIGSAAAQSRSSNRETDSSSADALDIEQQQVLSGTRLRKLELSTFMEIARQLFPGEFPKFVYDSSSNQIIFRGTVEEVTRAAELVKRFEEQVGDWATTDDEVVIDTVKIPEGKQLPDSAVRLLEHWIQASSGDSAVISVSDERIAISCRGDLLLRAREYIDSLFVDETKFEAPASELWTVHALVLAERPEDATGIHTGLDSRIRDGLIESAGSFGLANPVVVGQLMMLSSRDGESRSLKGNSALRLDRNASLEFDGVWLDGDQPKMEMYWSISADVVIGNQSIGGISTELTDRRTVTEITTKIRPQEGHWTVIGSAGMPEMQVVFAIGFGRTEENVLGR